MPGNMKKLRIVDNSEAVTFVASEDLRIVRNRSLYERRFKRAFDVIGALFVLLITLPLLLGIALSIRVGLGKGVFYRQRRVGLDGAPFMILKFRTMRPDRRQSEIADDDHQDPVQEGQDRRSEHKGLHDPRHTGLGQLLRRLSLDELPQLINVIRGEMSLVGPRPELVDVASDRGYLDHLRHDVRPGMTGPYQVSELRLNGDLRDGLELDEAYVNSLTFTNDLGYLARTITVMVRSSSGS